MRQATTAILALAFLFHLQATDEAQAQSRRLQRPIRPVATAQKKRRVTAPTPRPTPRPTPTPNPALTPPSDVSAFEPPRRVDRGPSPVTVGTEFGLNLGTISVGPDDFDTGSRTGILAGVNFEMPMLVMGEEFFLQPSLVYVQKGGKRSFTNLATGINTDITVKYNYLEVPVLAKAKFQAGEFKPYIAAGPSLGLKLSSEEERVTGSVNVGDQRLPTEPLNLSVLLATGLEYPVSPNISAVGNLRYQRGITNVSRQGGIKIRPHSWQFTVGGQFVLF